jgi:predicted Zn-dependent peptidase
MHRSSALSFILAAGLAFVAAAAETVPQFQVPVTYYKLPNGLRVVLSRDTTAPLAVVAVYYNIGFRVEPRDRTGFAHLFEHMMFQGSSNLGKMELIKLVESNGGLLNGSTRLDFTNYYEVVPSNKLETFLWAEADRMKGLAITQDNLTNQQGVVGNEVKVNVLNQPYGGFPWLDMPQYANKNWYNAHNFYGDLKDIEAATLDEVKAFFKTYYAPNNAALVVVGDIDETQAKQWIEKYFAGIPSQTLPAKPDLTEPRQEKEQRFNKVDKLANKPALAFAYHIPERGTPEHYAMVLLDQILLQGADSLLNVELVKRRGFTDSVDGGINLLGNAFDYSGPMLWMANLVHDPTVKSDDIMAAADQVIAQVQAAPPSQALVDRALVKFRSGFYADLTQFGGFGRANYLASLALFNDNPGLINSIEPNLKKVTPAMIQQVAKTYLQKSNRTILTIQPGAAEPPSGK